MKVSEDRRLPSAQHLARDFGARSPAAREGIAALYGVLAGNDCPAARAARTRWETVFGDALGQPPSLSDRNAGSLARCYGLPLEKLDPTALLLAVQTYYATLVKLLAWHLVAESFALPPPGKRFAETCESDRLRRELERWENGDVWGQPDLLKLFESDPFSWYLAAWNEPLERWLRTLAVQIQGYCLSRNGDWLRASADESRCGTPSRGDGPHFGIGSCDAQSFPSHAGQACDLFKDLYPALFPKGLRHALGQYYTPDWLAEHLLDEVGYAGQPDRRLLDPACGSGTFLVAAVNRIRAACGGDVAGAELGARILASVVGFDLDPLAVATARANYLIAIRDLLPVAGRVTVPVLRRDSIVAAEMDAGAAPAFDYVVGNPPWIAWDHLPAAYREATKPLWQHYGLFSLSGTAARHGGGKKDLSMLMLYVAADRYLKDRGRLGLVMTQTPFQSKGAGDGFRRFRLGESGAWLRVLQVHDMADFQPFPGAANWTSTVVLEKGEPTVYPVPYVKWSPARAASRDADAKPPRFQRHPCEAQPIDAQQPTSPWLVRPQGLGRAMQRLIGPSDYHAHLGANSGGANAVYWLRLLGPAEGGVRVQNGVGRAKRDATIVEQVVEGDLLYPLLRWGDVARYCASCSAHLLLAQDVQTRRGIDPATLSEKYPQASRYLQRFQTLLESRAAYRRYQQDAAFWSMYDVGPYTVAPIKVVWRRMDRRINAAVVGPIDDPWLGPRPVIPQETCVLVPAETLDEAHYLCAAMNSTVVNYVVRAHSVRGGKGFGTPSILDFLGLRRFQPADERHAQLAAHSRQAHERAQRGEDYADLQRSMDRLAGQLWGLEPAEFAAIEREEDRAAD